MVESVEQPAAVVSSIALPDLARSDSERPGRRGRKRGPAWLIEPQLVSDLVAGVIDMNAPRTVVAAHGRALLAARGFHYGSDYTRQRLDAVVLSAIQTARARLARARDPGRPDGVD